MISLNPGKFIHGLEVNALKTPESSMAGKEEGAKCADLISVVEMLRCCLQALASPGCLGRV